MDFIRWQQFRGLPKPLFPRKIFSSLSTHVHILIAASINCCNNPLDGNNIAVGSVIFKEFQEIETNAETETNKMKNNEKTSTTEALTEIQE